ncbi:hypothetical protein E1A91_D07G067900v1 [Gossypium mustelinum]|uniref:Uncharacterized protein n=4 Tax=Gossypium TaxID=3633 RepID=A0A5D2U6Y7_GOSMU|nr:hypothetical protein ES332_D07G069000v1 [Gossypium tomentosum]TYI72520.1 hypothetical protein E1A91_D07G067900v1 [Gossypium mustelinum]
MAKVFQTYIHTKLFSLLTKSASLPPPPPSTIIDIESATEPISSQVHDPQNYLAWEKQIVAFCLGSSIEIAILFAEIGPQRFPVTFILVSVAIMLAFTCICVGKCYMNSKFHVMARKLEELGGFFMVTAFFIAIAIPFPLWLQCCTGTAYAMFLVSILACNFF